MEKLSDLDKKKLLSNPYVEKITDSHISFSPGFKILAVERNLKGETPVSIFNSSGIDASLLSAGYPKKCISRWKKIYNSKGPDGFLEETRGKSATGRPKRRFDTDDIESLKARLAYVEMENDFLKKLHALVDLKEKKSSR